jgi:hypothetical protein
MVQVDKSRIKIYDIFGRIVYSEQFNPVGKNMLKLGQNLPKGIYIVQVEAGNTVITTQKIIKN